MLTKTHPPTASPPIVAVLSKTRHALVALALLFIAPPLYADTFTSCSDVTQMPEAQCNTLVALYDNTAGANWSNNTGWKQTDTPCSWFGVTCSGGEVTQISLSSNQLTGPIPSLNTLTSLQTLNITGNQLCQDSNANYAGWTEVDEFPSCDDPNYGLILHLLFDGNANDASGNSHNGIENQVNYVPGVNGQAAYFDGNEAYVKILDHDALDANDSMTLSLWIKPEQLNAQNGSWIISKWCSSGPVCSPDNTPKGDWGLRTGIPSNSENTDDILFFVQNYPEYQASAIAKAKSVLSVDTWQHVVATFDKGVQKLYLNGQLLKETTSSLTHLSKEEYDTDDIFIGKIWLLEDNKYNYTGAVDELFIYNRALSASEILSHYDSTKPATSETVLEDAEDGDTQGWSISANPQGDSAFANVVDSEKDSRVIELTGNSRSTYKFVFPDGSPLSTNNFIARWDLKMATGFGTVFWRVETTGSVIYMEYRLNTPLGCHLSSKSTYAICGLGDMQENTWYTITRDFKADLKAVGLDIELQSVEYLLIHSAGRVDDIQLLNRNDVNFHTISGTITNNGQGVSSKSLSNTGADCQPSDSNGDFTCKVPEGWYGSLTPENTNEHYFAPLTRAYNEVSEDITGQDFTVRLIEDGLEDAEDGDTDGWNIYSNTKGDAAFANVVESETNNRVIELTGHTSSGYQFAFSDGSPLSTTRFIVQWRMKKPNATDWQPVYWRVKTSGDIIYIEYHANGQKGCRLDATEKDIICVVGANMPANTWHTFTRDLKADLKTVKPDIELLEVEYLSIRMAGQIDDIKLLKEMPAIDCNTVTEIPSAQCEALVALYDSTDGDNWTNNEGWNVTSTPCSWYGVSCENGVVTTIDLDDNNLTGTLPDWSALTSLQELLLGHNKITETIPGLSNLTNLKVLSLKYNDLSGAIPELSHLSQLTTLWLEGNNLIGSIPDLSGLSSLTGMSLAANQLSGEIPDLSGLTSAHSIYLGDNQLTGSIPDLSRVTHLWNFSVANNQLSGEIPSLASLPKLESFDLTGDNKLCRNTEADYAGRTEVDAFPVCGTQAPEPVIAISEPQEQSDGLAVSFDASGSTDSDPDGQITSYTWITSDGQIFPGVNPTITFSEPGEQTVTLIIADNTGKTTAVEQTITVAKPLEILSLTITKRGTGKGEFHSTAPDTAIDCDIDCQRAKNDYNSDIVVTLQATPAPGSIFTSWGNGCGGTSNPTTVTMNRQKYCTATFDLDPAQRQLHRFRIAKIGDGSGRITVKQDNDIITKCSSADCEAKYFPSGTELALTVNIADDATFVGWSEDCHGTEPSITVTIEHATKCTAELALRPPEPIERRLTVATAQETVSPSQGTVTSQGIECGNGNNGSDDCVENYPHGQQLWLKAAPAPHSYFKEWTDDCSGTGSATTLIMDTDKTCTAIFGSDSDTNANDMVKTFLDECQLSNGEQFTDTYPPFNNEHRLEETYRLIENVMTKIKEHLVLTGSWPHQLHGIEWYLPLPSYLYTKSIQVISGGTTVKQANGIEEYVEGNYLKVEVLLITETGTEEIMPILISPEQAPPESSSTMRRGGGYCWWWYRPWRR